MQAGQSRGMELKMWLQNKFFQRIHNKSGASLVFVLAVMLLLMQVGVSALLAASAGAGAGINERVGNQMNMYADSVQKSVMYSLQTSSSDEKKVLIQRSLLAGNYLERYIKGLRCHLPGLSKSNRFM